MNVAGRVVSAAVLGAVGIWVWLTFFPSPERVIRRRLETLARDASFAPGQGYVSQLARAQALSGFFSSNVELNVDLPGLQDHRAMGRDEISQAALGERALGRGVDAKFPDISVVVDNEKQTALADVTLVARVTGQKDLIVEELRLTLEKVDGKWLIRKIETVRPLSWSGRQVWLLSSAC